MVESKIYHIQIGKVEYCITDKAQYRRVRESEMKNLVTKEREEGPTRSLGTFARGWLCHHCGGMMRLRVVTICEQDTEKTRFYGTMRFV